MKLGIVGYGFVGKAVEFGFKGHDIKIYDKYKDMDTLAKVIDHAEILWLCLPTPFDDTILEIDLSIYDEAMEEICNHPNMHEGKVIVIKSTVVPETTANYARKYPQCNFVFNPEFLTEASANYDFVNSDRIVIGSSNDWVAQKVIDLYRSMECFQQTPILKMSTTSAEMVKYMANVMLATKVAVANVFYDMCQKIDISYDDVRHGVGSDKRIGTSHLSISSERGFGGKCFPKDLGAIIGKASDLVVDCKLLKEVYDYNLRIRKVLDWKEIAGAVKGGRKYT